MSGELVEVLSDNFRLPAEAQIESCSSIAKKISVCIFLKCVLNVVNRASVLYHITMEDRFVVVVMMPFQCLRSPEKPLFKRT